MIGFCKCDICGKVYHPDENKYYDGLMVWYNDKDGNTMHGNRKYDIVKKDVKTVKTVKTVKVAPEVMDICPRCFDRFCDWIKTIKEESK